MNFSKLKLITFDVTDTLLQFRKPPGKQYVEIGAKYGVQGNKEDITVNFKEQWKKMSSEHPNFGRKSGLGWENWWKMIVLGTFKGANVDKQKLEAISEHLIDVYKTSICWQPTYGALGLLGYLKNRGVTLGVVSNFDERLSATLENTNLRHYFLFVLTSYEAGFEKPDERIFDLAMKKSRISDLKPKECLHIGDKVLKDYAGAKKAGWQAFLVDENTPMHVIKNSHPDIHGNQIYRNLYDLHKYLLLCA